jgi:acetyl-CoA carboxylase carboxyl transferase subunit beta
MTQISGQPTSEAIPGTPAAPIPAAPTEVVGPPTWEDAADAPRKKAVPEGLWIRCPECGDTLFRKYVESNLWVCSHCEYHFRISAAQRVKQLADPETFEPFDEDLEPGDPLGFVDQKPYMERLLQAQRQTGQKDGVFTGTAFVKGRKVILACMDFTFMAGSMGSVIGEKITRAIEVAGDRNLPLVIVSCSGGARMQESGLSLMQMAKTSAALARFDEQGGLYISVLADPTTGGVTASFAMLGDVIFAEPKALIGFAGPRVIAQTIRQELPEGFQRAEFLLEAGFVDRIVHRNELRSEISRVIDFVYGK